MHRLVHGREKVDIPPKTNQPATVNCLLKYSRVNEWIYTVNLTSFGKKSEVVVIGEMAFLMIRVKRDS